MLVAYVQAVNPDGPDDPLPPPPVPKFVVDEGGPSALFLPLVRK